MKISLLDIPKDIKRYYEVRAKTRRGEIGVEVIAYTTREEAEKEAKRIGGWVEEIVVKNPKKEKKENENIGII